MTALDVSAARGSHAIARSARGEAPLGSTLNRALQLLEHVDYTGPTFLESRTSTRDVPFASLLLSAAEAQAVLEQAGLRRGDCVAVFSVDPQRFLVWFLAAVRGGFLPVAVARPVGSESVRRALDMLDTVDAAAVVCSGDLWSTLAAERPARLCRHVSDDAPPSQKKLPPVASVDPDDPCLLQFSSGSTGFPKAIQITHRNLVANASLIVTDAVAAGLGDKGVSWLPMHHDMGLIGMALAPLLYGMPVVFMPPSRFVRSPQVWMETVSRHRGTVTFAPNFALDLAVRKADPEQVSKLDLACLRLVGCGAEPIRYETMQRFASAYAPAGLRWEAIVPCYGMAEATLAVSFDIGSGPRELIVDRNRYELDGVVEPLTTSAGELAKSSAMSIVGCGRTNASHDVGIFEDGRRVGDNHVGEVWFRGDSVARQSAVREPGSTREWLRTGDLGFVRDGCLYVAGREKDLIIVNGRNFFAQEIEWTVAEQFGLRSNGVAAVAIEGAATEEVLLLFEAPPRTPIVASEVAAHVQERLGVHVAHVLRVAPGQLPRTTSGKLRRKAAKKMWLTGRFSPSPAPSVEGPRP